MSVIAAAQRFRTSRRTELDAGMDPRELWDRHGASLFAMARVVLGDESQTLRAVTLGMVDLYRRKGMPSTEDARGSAALCIFRHCEQISREASIPWTASGPPLMTWIAEAAPLQRQILALCVYGGHTYREAGAMLGMPADSVARLLNAGLRDLTRSTSSTEQTLTPDSGDVALRLAVE